MNMRVSNLIHESDQSMNEHRKFKQLIGYKDKKIRLAKRAAAAVGASTVGRFDVGEGIAVGAS